MGDLYTAYRHCYCGGVCPENECRRVTFRREKKTAAWGLAKRALLAALQHPNRKSTVKLLEEAMIAMDECGQA